VPLFQIEPYAPETGALNSSAEAAATIWDYG
jgi:hypothetical protein